MTEQKFKHKGNKFALAITGGGSLFVSDCMTKGGASEWLVNVNIPYDTNALEKYVGGAREKYCSCSTARQLAVSAEKYAKDIGVEAIGIGCTASLSKGGDEREGRIHQVFVAATYKAYSVSVEWKHTEQKYSRWEEEQIAGYLIKEVAERFSEYINDKTHLINSNIKEKFIGLESCKIWSQVKVNFPSEVAVEKMSTLINFAKPLAFHSEEAFVNFKNAKDRICIYSGSWNPIHEQHASNFKTCEKLYGAENCFLELSIANFEKPQIDSLELSQRLEGMRNLTKNILITTKPGFAGKIDEFRSNLTSDRTKIILAVGMDTFDRVEMLENGPQNTFSFLVFPRDGKRVSPVNFSGNRVEPESFNLPEGINISSSSLRRK